MSIFTEIASFFRQHELSQAEKPIIDGESKLVIGVSGGPDSLVLLHVLAERGLFEKSQLVVAHLNHQLRPNAVSDADFVREISADWGLSYFQEDVDVAGVARKEGLGIEHAGRKARYAFLASVAEKVGAGTILTAHNANDQVETVLMHLLRGTGLAGLRGILPVAPNPESPSLQVLRPMLNIWREEIVAYCEKFQLDPVIDSTNIDESYFRNRIRNRLIPHLLDYNPGLQRNLHNLAALVLGDYDDLQDWLQEAWPDYVVSEDSQEIRLVLQSWRTASAGLRRNLIRFAWSKLAALEEELSFRSVELVRIVAEIGNVGASVDMPAGIVASLEYDHLVFSKSSISRSLELFPQVQESKNLPLTGPSFITLNHGWLIETEPLTEFSYTSILANADPWTAFICADQLEELLIRPRIVGETLRPMGMAGQAKKVSDLMIDEKIPVRYRENWPLLASAIHVLWVVGYQLDERVRVTPECRRLFRVQFWREDLTIT